MGMKTPSVGTEVGEEGQRPTLTRRPGGPSGPRDTGDPGIQMRPVLPGVLVGSTGPQRPDGPWDTCDPESPNGSGLFEDP